jgi:tripeptidyl-peptidase-1
MLANFVIIVSILASFTHTAPSPIKHALHEKRETPAYDWIKVSRVESTAILPIRIGLSQGNLEQGHDMLMEV